MTQPIIQLDKTSLPNYIVITVTMLMAMGAVFVFSASASINENIYLYRFYEFTGLRQLIFFPIACVTMYIFANIDYHRFAFSNKWYKSPSVFLLLLSITLLIIVLIPRFGTQINQARRWLRIPLGPITLSFQPSELAKWSVVFFLAGFCDKFSHEIQLYWKRFVPVCILVGIVAALVIIEDLGTAAFILFLAFLILLTSGARLWHLLTPLLFTVMALAGGLIYSPYRMQRITAFLNPDKWADSANYQANQSLIALGSGGLFGKGLGRGICKYGHLPEDTTDFIFAIIGEELGFVGLFMVILLFVIFVWLGIVVIIRCKDKFGSILAGGIVFAIGIQAAINIAVVTVVLPTKGIPLPFVSSGGTSMLLSAIAVGVLINIAGKTSKDERLEEQNNG